jgi:hypothetical protein
MPPDFRDAAERHWEDANCLLADKRLANTDHLLGLSAECALKAVMFGLGMVLRPDGAPQDRDHRKHINDLWCEFAGFATGRGGARYAAMLSGTSNPFANWDVAHRYIHRNHFSAPGVEQHRVGCEATMQVLEAALLDGVVC